MTPPTTRKLCAALVLSALWIATPSCGSAPDPKPVDATMAGDDWIDNPGGIKDVLTAVGSAPIVGNKSAARQSAEANARGQMAANARAKVQQLISTWFKEAGDMLDERTKSSYVNNEGLVRQVTDEELIGSRVVKYKEREGYMYVLMVIDDPDKWTKQVGTSVRDRAIKDETLFKTEVMKQDFEKKLDALINRDADAATQAKVNLEKAYVK